MTKVAITAVADRDAHGDQLVDQLLAVALEQAGIGGLDRCRGEDAGGNRAERAADPVDGKDVERVVDVDLLAQQGGAEAQATGHEADHERATHAHEARGRRDRDEPGDRTAGGPDHADLAPPEVAGEDPGDGGRGGRGVGDDEGVGGKPVGGDGRTRVEPEPAKPQEPRTQDGHRHVVRLHPVAVHGPMADDQGDDERRHARADVDHRAAGEIERAELVQPAVGGPDPVRQRGVDQDRPQDGEQDKRPEPLALGEGAGDERRGDRREHHLEGREQDERHGGRVDRARLQADPTEQREVEPADQSEAVDVRPECEREPDDDPHDADQGQAEEAVHDGRQHILAAHQAAVEQGETGQHDHDQGRRHQQPGGISGVHARDVLRGWPETRGALTGRTREARRTDRRSGRTEKDAVRCTIARTGCARLRLRPFVGLGDTSAMRSRVLPVILLSAASGTPAADPRRLTRLIRLIQRSRRRR